MFTKFGLISKLRQRLASRFPNVFPLFGPKASIKRFDVETSGIGMTTERRSTGQTGTEFTFYPVLSVTPDVNGDYVVAWGFTNIFDGVVAYDSWADTPGGITNTLLGLGGGQTTESRLLDNRPQGRGGIGLGDVDFQALGRQDGLWHSWQIDVRGRLTSPSGAYVEFSGRFGPEDFRSSGVLSASISGFGVEVR